MENDRDGRFLKVGHFSPVSRPGADDAPTVLYESPKRVRALLDGLDALDGGNSTRPVFVARELTKTHEELWRGVLGAAVAWVDAGGAGAAGPGEPPRGEFTLVLDARPPEAADAADLDAAARVLVADLRAKGLSASAAAKAAAAQLGLRKSRVYQLALGDADASGAKGS